MRKGVLLGSFLFGGLAALGAAIDATGLMLTDLTTDDETHCSSSKTRWMSGSRASLAFNNDTTLTNLRWAVSNSKAGDAVYQFDAPTVVNAYGIWNWNGASSTAPAARAPKTWTFEGSNDGENWTLLDEQLSETSWTGGEYRCYFAGNKTAYTYYRMNITMNNGDANLQLSHLEYYNIEFKSVSDQFPGEVEVKSDRTGLDVVYTNIPLKGETISGARIEYGTSEDSLTHSSTATELTSVGAKFRLSGLEPHTVYYFRVVMNLGPDDDEQSSIVYSGMTTYSATLAPGSSSFLVGSNWSTGVIPNDGYTDVVIDGDASVATVVRLSSSTDASMSARTVTLDGGDELQVTKSRSGSVEYTWLSMLNQGLLRLLGHASGNEHTVRLNMTNGFTNEIGGTISIEGSSGRNRNRTRIHALTDSVNRGRIQMTQPLSDRNAAVLCFEGNGTFLNDGTVVFGATGSRSDSSSGAQLEFAGLLSAVEGKGEIVLDRDAFDAEGLSSYVRLVGGKTGFLTNGVNHTIRGAGACNDIAIINHGLIVAQGEKYDLSLNNCYCDLGGNGMRNEADGRMVAVGGKGLFLGNNSSKGSQFVNEGLLEARKGSLIQFRTGVREVVDKSSPATTITMRQGGRWAGAGRFVIPRPLTLTSSAVLAPGDLVVDDVDGEKVYGVGASTGGIVTFDTAALTLSEGTVVEMQFAGENTFDGIRTTGALALGNATLKIVGRPHGGTYRIIESNEQITGTFGEIDVQSAEGAKAPVLTFGQTDTEVEVDSGETDPETGAPIMTTETRTTYWCDATFGHGFYLIMR